MIGSWIFPCIPRSAPGTCFTGISPRTGTHFAPSFAFSFPQKVSCTAYATFFFFFLLLSCRSTTPSSLSFSVPPSGKTPFGSQDPKSNCGVEPSISSFCIPATPVCSLSLSTPITREFATASDHATISGHSMHFCCYLRRIDSGAEMVPLPTTLCCLRLFALRGALLFLSLEVPARTVSFATLVR